MYSQFFLKAGHSQAAESIATGILTKKDAHERPAAATFTGAFLLGMPHQLLSLAQEFMKISPPGRIRTTFFLDF